MEWTDIFKMVVSFGAGLLIVSRVNPFNIGPGYSPEVVTSYDINYTLTGDQMSGSSGDWLWAMNKFLEQASQLPGQVQEYLQYIGLPSYFINAIIVVVAAILFLGALKIVRGML